MNKKHKVEIDRQCLQLDISSQVEGEILKVRSQQDISLYGPSSMTNMQPLSTDITTPNVDSYKKISRSFQTRLFSDCQHQASLSEVVHALISQWQGVEPELKAIADNFSLNSSGFCDYSSLHFSSLKTSKGYYPVAMEKTLSRFFKPLQVWGMWGLGKLETLSNMCPSPGNGYSVWVFTGTIKQKYVNCPHLSDVIGIGNSIVYRDAGGDREYFDCAPTLRSLSSTNGHQGGSGAVKVRNYSSNDTFTSRPIEAVECEALMGWQSNSTSAGIDEHGNTISISQTQRKKMLGNGIVPQEITEILTSLKPILQRNNTFT